MGLMDKVKAQATQLADKAQEAGKTGQAKIEAVQARRRADALLEELGKITYHARTGTSSPADEARSSEIVDQLRQYEAEHGSLSDTEGTDSVTTVSSSAPATTFVPSPGPAAAPEAAATPAPASTPAPAGGDAQGIPKPTFGSSEL
jgi:hypothetical protein